MIGDAGEHVGEPSLRIDVVELCCDAQRRDEGGAVRTRAASSSEPMPARARVESFGRLRSHQNRYRVSGDVVPLAAGVRFRRRSNTILARPSLPCEQDGITT